MPCHICKQRHLPFLSVDILGTAKSIAKTSKILNQKTQYITLWKRISVRVNKTKKSLFKGFTDFKSENLSPPHRSFCSCMQKPCRMEAPPTSIFPTVYGHKKV